MTADFDDVDTDFDFVKKKRDSKQKRKTYGVPKIDFTNDKVTDQVGNVLKVLNALEHRRKNWFKSAEE